LWGIKTYLFYAISEIYENAEQFPWKFNVILFSKIEKMVIVEDSLPEMVKNYLTKIKDNLKYVETSKKRTPNSEYNQMHKHGFKKS
jgi:hypothetical protein